MHKAACASVIVEIEVKSRSEKRLYETLVITRVEMTLWFERTTWNPHCVLLIVRAEEKFWNFQSIWNEHSRLQLSGLKWNHENEEDAMKPPHVSVMVNGLGWRDNLKFKRRHRTQMCNSNCHCWIKILKLKRRQETFVPFGSTRIEENFEKSRTT